MAPDILSTGNFCKGKGFLYLTLSWQTEPGHYSFEHLRVNMSYKYWNYGRSRGRALQQSSFPQGFQRDIPDMTISAGFVTEQYLFRYQITIQWLKT